MNGNRELYRPVHPILQAVRVTEVGKHERR